jgi:hypothetical protein
MIDGFDNSTHYLANPGFPSAQNNDCIAKYDNATGRYARSG